jgi:hypothetical protein
MWTRLARGLTAAAILSTGAARATELTEKEAVRKFLSESPYSRESAAGVAVVDAESRGWSLWPNPTAAYSREGAGLTEIVQYEQPLAITGRLGLLRQAGVEAVGAARSQAGRTRWELISSLRAAFYLLLSAQEREAAVRAGMSDLDEIIRILRRREQEGEGSSYDRLRAERERSEIGTEIAAARIYATQARSQLVAFFSADTEPTRTSLCLCGWPVPAAATVRPIRISNWCAIGPRVLKRLLHSVPRRWRCEPAAAASWREVFGSRATSTGCWVFSRSSAAGSPLRTTRRPAEAGPMALSP